MEISLYSKSRTALCAGLLTCVVVLPSIGVCGLPQQTLLPAAPQAPEVQGIIATQTKDNTSLWELDAIPTNPGEETSPSSPEQQDFWDRLQSGAFDDICRSIKLNVRQSLELSDYAGVTVRPSRRLQRYANRTLALVDSAVLDIYAGYTQKILETTPDLPISIGLRGQVKGMAIVVRPLGTQKSCKELGHLINLMDFKTVVPVTAARLSAMTVGELWKLPLVLNASVQAGVSGPVGPAILSVSLGHGPEDAAGVTIFRLSPEAIRLRIRIDKARITNGAVKLTLPMQEYLGLKDGNGIIEKQSDRLAWGFLRKYIEGAIGLSDSTRDGRKILLEFIIDPRKPEQLDALTRLLKGDLDVLSILRRIAKTTINHYEREGSKNDEILELERKYSDELGAKPSFAGANDYKHKYRRFLMNLPILFRAETGSLLQFDSIVAEDKNVTLRMSQASLRRSNSFLNIPGLGQITKNTTAKTVQAFTRLDDKKFPDEPAMVYIRQEGYIRHEAERSRGMVENANAIMRLAGTRGEGTNEAMTLPAARIFPEIEPPPPSSIHDEDAPPQPQGGPIYRSAVSAFTLALNHKALQDILWSPAEIVVRAFANSLSGEDRTYMETILANGTVTSNGKIDYNQGQVKALFETDPVSAENTGPVAQIENLAITATRLVEDLVSAREGSWEKRCRALTRMVAGKGLSKLAYDDIIKVLVQLADPMDLSGEFSVHVHKNVPGEKDLSSRYSLNKANEPPALKEATKTKERFAEPSILVD